jgi:hypothetical protein
MNNQYTHRVRQAEQIYCGTTEDCAINSLDLDSFAPLHDEEIGPSTGDRMTERPEGQAIGSMAPAQNDSLHLSTHPEVSQVLTIPIALRELAFNRKREDSFALDPIHHRLAELVAEVRPAYDIPISNRHPAIAAAVCCPDLFLISIHTDAEYFNRTAELLTAALESGQRLLLLTNEPDRFIERFPHDAIRVLGEHESIDRLPTQAAERTAIRLAANEHASVRGQHLEAVRLSEARYARAKHRDELLTEVQQIQAELGRVDRRALEDVEASETFQSLKHEWANNSASYTASVTQLESMRGELAELCSRVLPTPSFLARLFGFARPDGTIARRQELENRLRDQESNPPPNPDLVFQSRRQQLLEARETELRTELQSKLARIRDRHPVSPDEIESAESLQAEFEQARAALGDFEARPCVLSAEARSQIRLVVGPHSAVRIDSLLTTQETGAEPWFNRVIWTEAEMLCETDWAMSACLGSSWILIGQLNADRLIAKNAERNGTHSVKADSFFEALWATFHDHPWASEGERPLVRLIPVPPEHRPNLTCEPLFGRSDVEVRFTETSSGPELAEVVFPAGMTTTEAKVFLAAESGEMRFCGIGPMHWSETPTELICSWPLVDQDSTIPFTDLGHGIRERTCDTGWTAAIRFDTATEWTRDSAAAWLAARTPATSPRTAVVR